MMMMMIIINHDNDKGQNLGGGGGEYPLLAAQLHVERRDARTGKDSSNSWHILCPRSFKKAMLFQRQKLVATCVTVHAW